MRLLSILLVASFINPASKPLAELAGIAHVAVRVSDVAKSREFYQKLGFEQSFEFNDPRKTPVSYMKVMITSLSSSTSAKTTRSLLDSCTSATKPATLKHCKKNTWKERSRRRSRRRRGPAMLFIVRDPADQIVEFTQYMPGSLQFDDLRKIA